jgi:ATP-dependent DNA helicase 2 subunit 2
MKALEAIKMSDLKELQRNIQPSHTYEGDAISAIVVAIDLIEKATTLKSGKPGKFKRTIVLLTDGQGEMDADDIDDIAAKIKEVDIELKVM